MKIQQLYRAGVVLALLFVAWAAYTAVSDEAEEARPKQQCCSQKKHCPQPKPASRIEGSIIWESIFANLLSSSL